MKCFIELV